MIEGWKMSTALLLLVIPVFLISQPSVGPLQWQEVLTQYRAPLTISPTGTFIAYFYTNTSTPTPYPFNVTISNGGAYQQTFTSVTHLSALVPLNAWYTFKYKCVTNASASIFCDTHISRLNITFTAGQTRTFDVYATEAYVVEYHLPTIAIEEQGANAVAYGVLGYPSTGVASMNLTVTQTPGRLVGVDTVIDPSAIPGNYWAISSFNNLKANATVEIALDDGGPHRCGSGTCDLEQSVDQLQICSPPTCEPFIQKVPFCSFSCWFTNTTIQKAPSNTQPLGITGRWANNTLVGVPNPNMPMALTNSSGFTPCCGFIFPQYVVPSGSYNLTLLSGWTVSIYNGTYTNVALKLPVNISAAGEILDIETPVLPHLYSSALLAHSAIDELSVTGTEFGSKVATFTTTVAGTATNSFWVISVIPGDRIVTGVTIGSTVLHNGTDYIFKCCVEPYCPPSICPPPCSVPTCAPSLLAIEISPCILFPTPSCYTSTKAPFTININTIPIATTPTFNSPILMLASIPLLVATFIQIRRKRKL